MVVDTKYGEFEVKDITRKERRELYKKVKEVYSSNDENKLHELGDEFALLAFGNDENADKALGKLSAVEEDQVLVTIISFYMGIDLGNPTGD
tara:strand:+ start:2351 stop:2626 length:276 start_codon:yes stop_codon:yes gene_type:complete